MRVEGARACNNRSFASFLKLDSMAAVGQLSEPCLPLGVGSESVKSAIVIENRLKY